MATASLTAIANEAALYLAVIDSGESLSAAQLADLKSAANDMFDNWSSEGLFALADLITTWTLAAGTQNYSIGAAQTINVARPVRIVAAAFRNSAGPGGPIEVVNEQKWASLPDRQRQSWVIDHLFWDRASGTGAVYVSPIPLGTLTGEIHTWVPLTQFADLTTPITILPGYSLMIKLGLAMLICSQFSMNPPDSLRAEFADAAARVRKLNAGLLGDIPPEAAGGAA